MFPNTQSAIKAWESIWSKWIQAWELVRSLLWYIRLRSFSLHSYNYLLISFVVGLIVQCPFSHIISSLNTSIVAGSCALMADMAIRALFPVNCLNSGFCTEPGSLNSHYGSLLHTPGVGALVIIGGRSRRSICGWVEMSNWREWEVIIFIW